MNAPLGLAGQKFIEDSRLQQFGKEALADRFEHSAVTKGNEAGFNIRSFKSNGTDALIEVKTAAYGEQTVFHIQE
jgi:hypothetical protein